jgi:hypothetical protein
VDSQPLNQVLNQVDSQPLNQLDSLQFSLQCDHLDSPLVSLLHRLVSQLLNQRVILRLRLLYQKGWLEQIDPLPTLAPYRAQFRPRCQRLSRVYLWILT